MERNSFLWTLVVFFGSAIVFRAIYRATEDESRGVSIVLGLAALGLMIGVIVAVVKWRERR